MKLKTNRLTISEVTYEESTKISAEIGGDSVNEFLATLTENDVAIIFRDQDAVSDLLTRFSNSIGDGNSEIYGAWKDGELIGFIAIVNGESGTPELQIEIAPEFQNKGYGFEFLDALLNYLFEKNDFEYIRYTVLPNNKPSISLVNHIGASLQKPKSEAERLLICTYHITKENMAKKQAH